MEAEIIAIGSELLLGITVDTNSAYLAQQLASIGVSLKQVHIVGDNTADIATAVTAALARVDVVVCTGGLGPTLDDVTREGVAQALARPLEFRQDLMDQISARFAAFNRPMSESNQRQAYIPIGARIIENPHGTAPAFIVEESHGTVIVLPGVPHEMRYLFEHAVTPYLRDERGIRDVIIVRIVHAVGLGESVIGERIADLMRERNPEVGISAKKARYELRIRAQADSVTTAETMLAKVETTLRERLGEHLLGTETLDRQVLRLLDEQTLTLALYEGSITAPVYNAIRATAHGLSHLCGVIIHPLDQPTNEQAAATLALSGAMNACSRWQSDLALGIQAATIPEPSGFTAISVALVFPSGNRQITRHYDLRQSESWKFVGTLALELLRHYLLDKNR